ncbi:hypothetical protein DERP_012392 [Dermatophagoides pteronyssinus]|uniref:Uncharacterized protein n=1 Tax=Dermatophagoides pteronyssinus TaxID=6956 RepID=A0ABQ8IUX4_DERPT|nr:hypothetical protein DERP_012392 [Dermatophagoides pteronyssinus]
MITSAEFESRPLVGSSIQMKLGIRCDISSKASANRFRCPPEHLLTSVLAVSIISSSFNIDMALFL